MNEVELTLVIISGNPQRVSHDLSAISELAGFTLVPQNSKRIHDLYFDTPDLQLKGRLLSLRLRYVNGKCLVAFKGPPNVYQTGIVERFELESSWSVESFEAVIREVKSRKVVLVDSLESVFHSDPQISLRQLGFQVIQNRESHRKIRDIYQHSYNLESESPIAELVIDDLLYQFDEKKVRHHELEMELRPRGNIKLLDVLASNLMEKFGPSLRKWEHSKLVTGLAIQELMRSGALDDDIAPNHNLMPDAYEKIRKFLETKAD